MNLRNQALPVKSLQKRLHRDLLQFGSFRVVRAAIDICGTASHFDQVTVRASRFLTILDKGITYLIQKLEHGYFDAIQLSVLKIGIDRLVNHARMTLEKLVVEEVCQQVPSEHPNPPITRLRKSQYPPKRLKLAHLLLERIRESAAGFILRSILDPQHPPLAQHNKCPDAYHDHGGVSKLVEDHFGRRDFINNQGADEVNQAGVPHTSVLDDQQKELQNLLFQDIVAFRCVEDVQEVFDQARSGEVLREEELPLPRRLLLAASLVDLHHLVEQLEVPVHQVLLRRHIRLKITLQPIDARLLKVRHQMILQCFQ